MMPIPPPISPPPPPPPPPPPDPFGDEYRRLLQSTGYRDYDTSIAGLQQFLGLAAAAAALVFLIRSGEFHALLLGGGLFVLGGMLILAGHYTRLYQSHNRLAAYLATVIRDTGNRHEHSG